MIDINKEAEEYANSFRFISETDSWFNNKCNSFIAGHNSKATQAKVLQAKIDVLTEHRNSETIYWLDSSIKLLQQQLEQLKNEN